MLNFVKIKKEDLSIIAEYLKYNHYKTCDFTLLGIYMWVDYFGYEYALENQTLYIRATKEIKGYLPPLSKEDKSDNIRAIFQHAKEVGEENVTFVCAPESFFEKLTNTLFISKQANEDWSDYTYPIENLALLNGKKFSKKRNLIHQFLGAYPNYEYCEINFENLPKIKAFNKSFKNGETSSFFADYETQQTQKIMEEFFDYNLVGRVIMNAGEVLGFAVAEVINDTLYVHIEKASREVKGVYQMLNMLLCKEFFDGGVVKIINREEDVGDEGLKKAKGSYYPKMIYKYKVVIKNEL